MVQAGMVQAAVNRWWSSLPTTLSYVAQARVDRCFPVLTTTSNDVAQTVVKSSLKRQTQARHKRDHQQLQVSTVLSVKVQLVMNMSGIQLRF